MGKIIIAIDGYSSCGKSTLAKTLAKEIGYAHVDTGSMYRCVTLYAQDNGLIENEAVDTTGLINQLDKIEISFEKIVGSSSSLVYLNGVNVEDQIRGMNVSIDVSKISVIKEVRDKMVAMQQRIGRDKGVVMEGRDIGTVVFPDAELKIFMTASIDIRVQRRFDELQSRGLNNTLQEVKDNVISRDYEDTHRTESPLVQAEDAVVLDNSDMSRDEQLEFVFQLVRERS
ncbi:MAG: (d)CMP kinase [Flavobacteriales bacterium]|nr:(d)CMP kinase [Flavobacteriales bacterium]